MAVPLSPIGIGYTNHACRLMPEHVAPAAAIRINDL